MTKPLIALLVFNGIFSIYHIPVVMDAVKMNVFIHASYTILLFVLALFLWWPLTNKLEEKYPNPRFEKSGVYSSRWHFTFTCMWDDYICSYLLCMQLTQMEKCG